LADIHVRYLHVFPTATIIPHTGKLWYAFIFKILCREIKKRLDRPVSLGTFKEGSFAL
jgi:hypothetical protein